MRLLFIDASTKLKTVRDLDRNARGGMVTSLFRVTDYLARRGHHVYVVSDIASPGQTKSGVNWVHEPYGDFDVLVANRGVGNGYPAVRASARVLWTHDLPHSGFIPEPKTIKAFNRVVFMSRFAERIWRAFYQDIGKSVFIPNGVDRELFYPREKERGYMIYASAPNRGLKDLPLIVDSINTRVEMDTYCRAFSNLSKLHPNEGEDVFDYKSIKDSQVELHDPIPQRRLAAQMGRAGLLLLPSDYPEICSNVVLQALACGTPIITTGNMGATCEWVKHGKNGMLTKWQRHNYMIHTLEMVRNSVKVLEDEWLHRKLMHGARGTKIYSWQEIGKKWEKMLNRLG